MRTRWVASSAMVSCLLANCDLVISWGQKWFRALIIPESFVFHEFVQSQKKNNHIHPSFCLFWRHCISFVFYLWIFRKKRTIILCSSLSCVSFSTLPAFIGSLSYLSLQWSLFQPQNSQVYVVIFYFIHVVTWMGAAVYLCPSLLPFLYCDKFCFVI